MQSAANLRLLVGATAPPRTTQLIWVLMDVQQKHFKLPPYGTQNLPGSVTSHCGHSGLSQCDAITSATVMTVVTEQQLPTQDVSICNISDIRKFNYKSRLLNTSVYVSRFCYRTGVKGTPTVDELQSTENAWLRHEQQRHYPQVFSYLLSPEPRRNLHIPPIVRQLNLFLGEDGLTHIKGRFTRNSSLILLPKHSYLTKLLILNCHHRMCQVGVGGTIVSLRDRFWVSSARSETRRYLSKCVQCKRVSGRYYSLPLPPELPHFRFDTSIRPFSNVGVDFTRHLIVKNRSGEHIKFYICLFTCLTTRAINLEIVQDITTHPFFKPFDVTAASSPHPDFLCRIMLKRSSVQIKIWKFCSLISILYLYKTL